jgi:hypothetical protein
MNANAVLADIKQIFACFPLERVFFNKTDFHCFRFGIIVLESVGNKVSEDNFYFRTDG